MEKGFKHGKFDEPTRKPTYAELESRVRSLEQALCDPKTAEEELRRSEARYRRLFNTAMDAVYLLRENGYFYNGTGGVVL
jgi:PAS domain-containing protein